MRGVLEGVDAMADVSWNSKRSTSKVVINVIIIRRDNLQIKRYTFHSPIFKSELYVFEILSVIQVKNVMRILYLYKNKYICV